MVMVPVASSNIESVGYDGEEKVLRVQFRHGGLYEFDGVSKNEHAELMAAESVGGHFAIHIKPKAFRRVN